MNAVAPYEPGSARLIPPYDRATDDIIRSCLTFTVGGAPDGVSRLPTPEQRQALALRQRELDIYNRRDTKRAAGAITAMLTGFSKYHSIHATEAAEREFLKIVNKYVVETASVPLFAVERACVMIRQGQAGPDIPAGFPPSTAQVFALATKCAQPLRTEQAMIHMALTAKEKRPEITQEQREIVKEGLTCLAREFRDRHGPKSKDSVQLAYEMLEGLAPGALAAIPDLPKGFRRAMFDPEKAA